MYQPSSPRFHLPSTPVTLRLLSLPSLLLVLASSALPTDMSAAAGRKKSVISSATPTIDSPIANNTLLNKAASQSTSLYQQCSALRTRLMHVREFTHWLSASSMPESSRRSTDAVTQLWDCFVLGYPLCYLFNLLPDSFKRIDVSADPASFDNTEKAKKRAILLFAMRIPEIEGCEGFTVSEILDRNSTDGLVKVHQAQFDVFIVSHIVTGREQRDTTRARVTGGRVHRAYALFAYPRVCAAVDRLAHKRQRSHVGGDKRGRRSF